MVTFSEILGIFWPRKHIEVIDSVGGNGSGSCFSLEQQNRFCANFKLKCILCVLGMGGLNVSGEKNSSV